MNAAFGRSCTIGHRCCVEIAGRGENRVCAVSKEIHERNEFLGDLNKMAHKGKGIRVSRADGTCLLSGDIEAIVVSGDIIASTLGSWDTI